MFVKRKIEYREAAVAKLLQIVGEGGGTRIFEEAVEYRVLSLGG